MANFFNLADKLGEFKETPIEKPVQDTSEEEVVHIEETEIKAQEEPQQILNEKEIQTDEC